VQVHLVDGTYELFRYFYALPGHTTADGREVAAVRGVLGTVLQLLEEGATHVGVATDHVIESFRNDLWAGYKTGDGVDPVLKSQFHPLEDALVAMGVTTWAMVEFEADDALAAAARQAAADPAVDQVVICTPDKDLGQCVVGDRIVQLDRRKGTVFDEAGVTAKFGVPPESIPDYLGLVGDTADGFPGIPGWGAKSAAAVLARYRHLEDIPPLGDRWDISVRGAAKLAAALVGGWEHALLFRDIATTRADCLDPFPVDDLRWRGPTEAFAEVAESVEAPRLAGRALAASRGRSRA
jgi:5'-3' exonuclease